MALLKVTLYLYHITSFIHSCIYSVPLIGKNSADVRSILESLVSHGAPEKILVDGKPHLGTDKLIVILRNIRAFLVQQGKKK